jgi:hypothetical protein
MLSDQPGPREYLKAILVEETRLSEKSAAFLIDEYGELDRTEHQQRKLEIDSQVRKAQGKLRHAPPDVKTLEDLLPKVNQIAAVTQEGEPP